VTIADVEAVLSRPEASDDELVDELYGLVKASIESGQSRADALQALESVYAQLAGDELERPRRVAREVIGCFYGYCAPEVAL
jgi:hypothetical protein